MKISVKRVDDTAKTPQPHISQLQTRTVAQ